MNAGTCCVSICTALFGSDGRVSRNSPRQLGLLDRRLRPEVRQEERDRPLEVAGVQEQRPALVAGRHVLAGGRLLGGGERQRQVAVAEQLAARALLQVQPVGRPEHPRAELGDGVVAGGLLPVAALAGTRAVRPLAELQGHSAHDELRRLGGEPRVPPPAQAALDVRVVLLRLVPVELGEHPGAEQPALEVLARVVLQQRPRGHVHREPGVDTSCPPSRARRAGSRPTPPAFWGRFFLVPPAETTASANALPMGARIFAAPR